ncbi:uncharacterized [Tachysurus ichikawai]
MHEPWFHLLPLAHGRVERRQQIESFRWLAAAPSIRHDRRSDCWPLYQPIAQTGELETCPVDDAAKPPKPASYFKARLANWRNSSPHAIESPFQQCKGTTWNIQECARHLIQHVVMEISETEHERGI